MIDQARKAPKEYLDDYRDSSLHSKVLVGCLVLYVCDRHCVLVGHLLLDLSKKWPVHTKNKLSLNHHYMPSHCHCWTLVQ